MAGTPLILQQDAEQTSVWLEDYFNRLDSAKAPHLLAAMRYSAMNGGKRVRASLVLSAARLASANTGAPLPAHLAVAGAVEMLHAYSLIHDDLPAMDDADLRRGVAACHKAFDEATAILAGDALQTEAFSILSRPGLMADAEQQLRLIAILAAASGQGGMAGGQMLDLLAETGTPDLAETRKMQELKTGALIQAAAMMGAIAGGGDEKLIKAVERFSSHLGLAFQIADDLLDYQADAEQIGKPAGRDAVQGKASFVEFLGLAEARAKADSLIDEACASLDDYGAQADGLRGLADFVINRNH
ncbi:MAG: polyprenyl synthetase family protein [Proteobacteria bacterium]|jgi:farnesyl diphosphate synthase|nr:polyprenyl synthetase family protein [Pseudomonadota bacterium]